MKTLRKVLPRFYISAESLALQPRVLVSVLFNRCRMCVLAGLDPMIVFLHVYVQFWGEVGIAE